MTQQKSGRQTPAPILARAAECARKAAMIVVRRTSVRLADLPCAWVCSLGAMRLAEPCRGTLAARCFLRMLSVFAGFETSVCKERRIRASATRRQTDAIGNDPPQLMLRH
jgi:hypothetical protein